MQTRIKLKQPDKLQQELKRLKSEKSALQIQSRLLENFVTFARSSAKEHVLTRLLQKTLEVSAELTGADKGSLFLLDDKGAVTHGILTRADPTPEQRSKIIGQVFDEGLAGWVRRNRKIGLIADTRNDDRWVNLPNQPYAVGSALAVPVLRGDNLMGIITLLHDKPDHFDQETADLMLLTAGQIASALENARLYSKLDESYRSLEQAKQEIETYSRALQAEMEKGRKIQLDFLPTRVPELPGWEIAFYFHPAREVSGDFYDAFLLPGDLVGLVIADVCDKGIGSALFMALFRSLIRVFSGQITLQGVSVPGSDNQDPNSTGNPLFQALHAVSLTNDYIAHEHGEEGLFATLFFGVLDPQSGNLAYVNGGHEPLIIFNRSGIKQRLTATGPAVGMMTDMEYRVEQVQMEPDDFLIGYTDGVTEALSPEKRLYSKQRFLARLEKPAPTVSQQIELIKEDIFDHIGDAPQFDDITMIALHRKSE
ncbi:MAG: SpoIIE family protein phosphatase [Deltaproteobacteria bacterium]|nr:SpoIIE family protein phosphatase [Deltaproteobacteria bacterium]MBW2480804.1 SpoIIE family protein phosphatase [Deltaproteobacteria bacterium]